MLSTSLRLFALCLGFAVWATPSAASTRVGVYAIIDEVTFEPSNREPDRVLISGAFVVPVPISSGDHGRPARGILYFSLNPDSPGPTRTDWRALRKAAGTGQVVGFGQYWMPCLRAHLTAAPPAGWPWPAGANCSLEVTVHTDRTKATAEPYPAPSNEGVVTAFDSTDDVCPRFGRPSVRIVAELRDAHSPGGARSEPTACNEWVGLVASSALERTFPTQARDAEWAEAAETLIQRRLAQAQGLALSELGVECRDTICHIRLAFPSKEYQQATGNRLAADALHELPGFAQGSQIIPGETDPTIDYYIQRRKPPPAEASAVPVRSGWPTNIATLLVRYVAELSVDSFSDIAARCGPTECTVTFRGPHAGARVSSAETDGIVSGLYRRGLGVTTSSFGTRPSSGAYQYVLTVSNVPYVE